MTTISDFNQLDLGSLLDANVVTASKKSERISQAPAFIEVLTRKQLLDLGARDLYQALTFLPGIELIQTYQGYVTLIFRGQLQEIYNSKILLLVNGHPAYEAITSNFYLELIPVEAIERIEVIRGPGSVLYGTNAFAGVINIITVMQQDEGTTTRLRAEGGSFSTGALGGGNQGRSGDLSWAAFVSGQKTNGYPYVIEHSQNEDCINPAAAPVPAHCAGTGPTATLDYFNNFANAYLDLQYKGFRLQTGGILQEKQKYGIAPIYRFQGPNDSQFWFAELSYRRAWEKAAIVTRLGVNKEQKTWEFGHFPLPSYQETRAEGKVVYLRGEVVGSYYPIEPVAIDLGASYEEGGDKSSGFFEGSFVVLQADDTIHAFSPRFDSPPQQRIASVYAQGTWAITEKLTAIAGDRLTNFESSRLSVEMDKSGIAQQSVVPAESSVNNSVRGGLVYTPIEPLTLKLLYGSAFRVPNIYESSAVLSQVIGTTPLKPETVRTWELGVDSRPIERLSFRTNGFYSVTDRLILRRRPNTAEAALFGANSTVYDNLPGQTIIGIEAALHAILTEQWTGFINGAWKELRDRKTKEMQRVAAPLTANLGVSYQPVSWLAVRPNAQYVGPRGDSRYYTLLNTVVDFPVTKHITLSAIGTNLLDKQYTYPEYVRQIVDTLPGGPGRAYYGRITAEF